MSRVKRASVDPELFKKARVHAGYETINALQRVVANGGKQVSRIEKGETVEISTLENVCWHLNIDWKTLINNNKTGTGNIPFSFPKLLTFADQVDEGKLTFLKTTEEVVSKYFELLQDKQEFWYGDRDYRFERSKIDDFFHNRIRINKYELNTLVEAAQSNLNIAISGLGKTLRFEHNQLGFSVDNADLIWPCNCQQLQVLANLSNSNNLSEPIRKLCAELKQQPCPLHGEPGFSKMIRHIDSIFGHCLVSLNIDQVTVLYKQTPLLWPPSIDVLVLTDILKSTLKSIPGLSLENDEADILDVGAGTGVLGIWLAKQFKKPASITYTDWLMHSSIFSYINHLINFQSMTLPRCDFFLSNKLDDVLASKKKFKISVCNPPYLPNPTGDAKLFQQSTVTGVDLLKSYVEHAPKIATHNFVIYSRIVDGFIKDWANECGSSLVQQGEWVDIPFRVPHYLNSLENVTSLLNDGLLTINPDKALPLRHQIGVHKVLKI